MDNEINPIPRGIIMLWYGSIATIPSGWVLCNGSNNTPDLDTRFVQGAGSVRAPGTLGGSSSHGHSVTGDGHTHTPYGGNVFAAGGDLERNNYTEIITGTTNTGSNVPLYHALCYIMKL